MTFPCIVSVVEDVVQVGNPVFSHAKLMVLYVCMFVNGCAVVHAIGISTAALFPPVSATSVNPPIGARVVDIDSNVCFVNTVMLAVVANNGYTPSNVLFNIVNEPTDKGVLYVLPLLSYGCGP